MRGILCNWLVVMGIWQATASKEIVSRVSLYINTCIYIYAYRHI